MLHALCVLVILVTQKRRRKTIKNYADPEGNRPQRSEERGRRGRTGQSQPRRHQRHHQPAATMERGAKEAAPSRCTGTIVSRACCEARSYHFLSFFRTEAMYVRMYNPSWDTAPVTARRAFATTEQANSSIYSILLLTQEVSGRFAKFC